MSAHACHEVRLRSPQSNASYASRCIAANLRLIVEEHMGAVRGQSGNRVTTVLLKASRGNVLRHGEARATKGLNAFGTSLTRIVIFEGRWRDSKRLQRLWSRFRWRDLICGLIEPGFETRLADRAPSPEGVCSR